MWNLYILTPLKSPAFSIPIKGSFAIAQTAASSSAFWLECNFFNAFLNVL